eukprot:5407156-Prymnesium_polylepis.1
MARVRDARTMRAGSHAEVMHQAGACVCFTRLTWGRCRVSGHSPISRAGSLDIGRQRSSGRPGT